MALYFSMGLALPSVISSASSLSRDSIRMGTSRVVSVGTGSAARSAASEKACIAWLTQYGSVKASVDSKL